MPQMRSGTLGGLTRRPQRVTPRPYLGRLFARGGDGNGCIQDEAKFATRGKNRTSIRSANGCCSWHQSKRSPMPCEDECC